MEVRTASLLAVQIYTLTGILRMAVCERHSCVRGYHVYKNIWDAVIGEEIQCERELHNGSDRYAVAVKKDGPSTTKNI